MHADCAEEPRKFNAILKRRACIYSPVATNQAVRGLVQTITGKINVIVTLRIYPPPPLSLTSCNELRKVVFNSFAM